LLHRAYNIKQTAVYTTFSLLTHIEEKSSMCHALFSHVGCDIEHIPQKLSNQPIFSPMLSVKRYFAL